jgi:hypothetical protein
MTLRHVGLIATAAAAISFAGCAGRGGAQRSADRYWEEDVKLFVTNLAFSDVTLYGITNGARTRLGTVIGKKEVVFTLPVRFPSEVYLEIDFLAGPRCFTERMMVDPGDHLDLTIQNENLAWRCGDS